MTTDTPPAGLREAKKQETRQLISDHATKLFMEQGFEQTTIAEIATAARIAKKTVTNYFARKEDLVLDRQDEFAETLARAVAQRREGESALAALRRDFGRAVAQRDPVAGFSGVDFARMVADSPTLSACLRGLHDRREERLAEVLATATASTVDDFGARTAAAVLGAVHRLVFQRIQELTLAQRPEEEIAKTVEAQAAQAFELLEPALGDYAADGRRR